MSGRSWGHRLRLDGRSRSSRAPALAARAVGASTAAAVLVAAAVTGCSGPGLMDATAPVLQPPPEVASGYRTGLKAAYGAHFMAAAANPAAAEAGRQMLQAGGSAIDAAVAMQAVLTLTEPQATGIGGGAFLVYWDGQRVTTFDGRETAPMGATEQLFLGADGAALSFNQARIGGRSVGVPGVLRALELAHRRHGRLPWAQLFLPAIRLAEQGFPISARMARSIAADRFIAGNPAMAAYLHNPDGSAKAAGTLLRNPELAQTLRAVATQGAGAFYSGAIAADITAAVRGSANPGSMTLADLAGYVAREREPLCSDYRGYRICGMGPPSSGAISVAQTLGTLAALEQRRPSWALAKMGPVPVDSPAGAEPSADAVHVISEAQRLAYADRDLYVADPGFLPLDVASLIAPTYLATRAELIGERSMGRASAGTPAGMKLTLAPDRSPPRLSTSQVVAIDALGGAVSMTTTVEAAFGAHLMVRGFMLNNQLTDFSFVPAEGGRPVANRVQPGKRPRSAMAPTLVFDGQSGQLLAALGSVGGSQIIEFVTKALIGVFDWQMDLQGVLDLPNFGSRNGPTELEAGLVSAQLIDALKARGHAVVLMPMTSGTQAILRVRRPDGSWRWAGAADPRREGVALGQ